MIRCVLLWALHTQAWQKNNKWRLSCHVESDSTWPVDGQILNCSWSGAEKRSQTCDHWGGQFSLCKKIAAICCWSVQFWEGFWRWGKKEFPPKQNIIGRDLWAGPANVSWLKVDFWLCFVFCTKIDNQGGCRGNAMQTLNWWWHPVASSEAQDVLHWEMHVGGSTTSLYSSDLHVCVNWVSLPNRCVTKTLFLLALLVSIPHFTN